jgi:hypothetical protein
MNTNAEGHNFNRQEYNQECPLDAPMMRANTKAHTGSSVSHTSIVMTPNANVITEKGVRTQAHLALMIDARTEDGEIPPIGDLLVNGHQTSVDIRLIRERAARLSPDKLAVVQKRVHNESDDRCK